MGPRSALAFVEDSRQPVWSLGICSMQTRVQAHQPWLPGSHWVHFIAWRTGLGHGTEVPGDVQNTHSPLSGTLGAQGAAACLALPR